MKLLFVHQNMPGQYREMLDWMAKQKQHEIVFLTQRDPAPRYDGVRTVHYRPHHVPAQDAYGLSKPWEAAAGTGYGAANALQGLVDEGFTPDLILGHVGWGEMVFFRQVLPDVPILGLFEFFYRIDGGPVGFDSQDPITKETPFLLQAKNALPFLSYDTVDKAYSPSKWQRDRYPKWMHEKIYVCHEGIRTDILKPNEHAEIALNRLDQPLTREDRVVTFMARNLERTRGFHQFMRAVPIVQAVRPETRFLIIGGNETSYGKDSAHPGGLRGEMEEELKGKVDFSYLHFLGKVPYSAFQTIIQLSACHLYLSQPFVVSWSLMEAMAMQAPMLASDVDPVREVIEHEKTGMLVDFFSPEAIAAQILEMIEHPEHFDEMRKAARAHIVENYDFLKVCLPEHLRQMNTLLPPDKQFDIPL